MSYAVVNRETCTFLPIKHHQLDVVCNMCWIEANHLGLHIFNTYDKNALKMLTDLELLLLYKNTTGQDKAPRFGEPLRKLCVELSQRVPDLQVEAHRVHMQAESIPSDHSELYKYNPKGTTPIKVDSLFKHDPILVPRAENEKLVADSPIADAPVRPAASRPAWPATPPAPGAQSAAVGQGGPVAPWQKAPPPAAKVAGPSDTQIIAPWLKK